MTNEEKITQIVKEFLADVTDENGNAREDMIDHAWETKPDENGYYIRLYLDWEYNDPAPEDIRRLDTFVELRKGEDVIECSSCYGYGDLDIEMEIESICGGYGLETSSQMTVTKTLSEKEEEEEEERD